MENASKALIIAGAILISILLISVGIIIMNSINNPVQQGARAADSQAIEMFNSKFSGYAGSGVDYNTAKQCITSIISSNGATPDHPIELTGISTVAGLDRTNNNYTIDIQDTDGDGYFDQCEIN